MHVIRDGSFVHPGLLHSKLLLLAVNPFGGVTVASGMLSVCPDATAKESLSIGPLAPQGINFFQKYKLCFTFMNLIILNLFIIRFIWINLLSLGRTATVLMLNIP